MSKVIIGIHGLGNKPPEKQLASWWKRSIREGLKAIGRPHVFFKFELVYWADVLYDQPQNINVNDPKHPEYLDDPWWPAKNFSKPVSREGYDKLKHFLVQKLKKVMLNDDKSINFKFISDAVIHRYFKDLETYFTGSRLSDESQPARDIIRQRLESMLHKYRRKDIMLIGHSMGSIVAYDVLKFTAKDIPVDTLVTIGSPLGLPVIISYLYAESEEAEAADQVIRTPENVRHSWINISDPEDKIAMDYHLSDDFEANDNQIKVIDQIVTTNYFNNGERNPHKAYGYLRTPELAILISDFFDRGKSQFYIKLRRRFNIWFSRKIEEWF